MPQLQGGDVQGARRRPQTVDAHQSATQLAPRAGRFVDAASRRRPRSAQWRCAADGGAAANSAAPTPRPASASEQPRSASVSRRSVGASQAQASGVQQGVAWPATEHGGGQRDAPYDGRHPEGGRIGGGRGGDVSGGADERDDSAKCAEAADGEVLLICVVNVMNFFLLYILVIWVCL